MKKGAPERVLLFCARGAQSFIPAPCRDAAKGDILFPEREYPPYTPKRKVYIGSLDLEELHALRNQVRRTWLRHESLRFVTGINRALLS